MDSLSFKENAEYEIILSKLKLDEERKKWVAASPYNTCVGKLIDNYSQARGYTMKIEMWLERTERMEEFNKQFQDNVCSRGVFRSLTVEEVRTYKGPVNYITMVEAFKSGPYVTTPLRICMNSSMKQPLPSGVSLNDCLLRGPSASVDLCTVTLRMRKHKVAFMQDISKFYQ
jgi:hypothetical protein